MGGSWHGLVVWAVLVGGAVAMKIISEEEGQELKGKIDGENVKLERETEREDRGNNHHHHHHHPHHHHHHHHHP